MRRRDFPALLAGYMAGTLYGAGPDATELALRCDQALKGKSQIGKCSMTVTRPEWERTLEMDFWSVNPDKTFILITAPAKEEGTGTLRIESNMWLYMPNVERTIKVPPSLMLQPWMGSDFTNDDLVRESSLVHDYTHVIDGEVTEGGRRLPPADRHSEAGRAGGLGQAGPRDPEERRVAAEGRVLRRARAFAEGHDLRGNSQRWRPELSDEVADGVEDQTGPGDTARLSRIEVRPEDPGPDLHATEPEAAVLEEGGSEK